jgi:hypothetical protein
VNRYRLWVKEQHIEHAATQFTTDLPLVTGVRNEVQVVLKNNSGKVLEGGLRLTLPNAWITEPATQNMHVETGRTATTRFMVTPPASARGDEELAAQLSNSDEVGKAAAHLLPLAKVPRLTIAPRMDNTESGWEKVPVLKITPKDLAEGHVSSESDSSANFRVAHDGQTLFVDVKVSDDVVVTNIAPNDIKGHWRSDSVEICVDPIGGAEHTFGCFKLGIFPFDTSGVVRAARDADANPGLVEERAPGTRLASWRTADGYRIRASIPFTELGLDYPRRKQFGFNLIIYDGDKSNAAPGENINKSRIAWAPRPGVQGRPEDWGRLELE